MEEDYCSFELSKLLKEKGFDWMCNSYYTNTGMVFNHFCCHYFADDEHDKVDILTQTLRPTHQMAMKWLREVHRKYIDIRYNNQNEEYRFIVFTMVKDKPIDFIHSEYHSTYEEAVEAAIKYYLTNSIEK